MRLREASSVAAPISLFHVKHEVFQVDYAKLSRDLAIIAGVVGVIALLGCPWMNYDAQTRQQIVTAVTGVATMGAGYYFTSRNGVTR